MASLSRVPTPRPALFAAVLCLLVVSLATSILGQQAADIAVVVHPGVGVDNLSLQELRRYLLGDRDIWPSGVRVARMIRETPRERHAFIETCAMTESLYRAHWISMENRAEIGKQPTLVVGSQEMALNQVSRTPGAITFIESPVASKTVKVLTINGKGPGQPGYPVK